jgi:hypothetical protein
MGPATFLRRLRRIMPPSDPSPSDAELRGRMVREQIEARGIRDPLVLEALRLIPPRRGTPRTAITRFRSERTRPSRSRTWLLS